MLRKTSLIILLGTLTSGLAAEQERPLRPHERLELVRGLMAESGTAKVPFPRSKKPLKIEVDGTPLDEETWEEAKEKNGPAARVGDLVQITKVEVGSKSIKLQLNGGWKSGRRWYDNIQVGMGTSGRGVPISQGGGIATAGTELEIVFPEGVPALSAQDIKKKLGAVIDFEKRTATEQYIDTLPPEIKKAVEEKRAIEGMDKDQVQLALGRPDRKVRENKEGVELEDWIYGQPPGRILFVTFEDNKVVRIKETYAGIGTQAAPLPVP